MQLPLKGLLKKILNVKKMNPFDFEQEVIEKSFEKPVLVDFWAPWCGPCRTLGPTIEQLAEEQADKWELVKVNTEEEQALAEQYQIRSIPNVKLFFKGKVIGEFLGALSKTAIQNWLTEHLPDDRLDEFNTLLEAFKTSNSSRDLEALKKFVSQNRDIKETALILARILVFTEPEAASAQIESIHMGDKWYDEAQDIKVLAELMAVQANQEPVEQALYKAKAAIQNDDLEAALQAVIDATTINKSFQDDLPRKAAIALFRLLGNQHELTKKYRWRFDMALY